MSPDITVVVITYQRPRMLSELVAVLEAQTIKPRIIIADDGTEHPAWSYCRERFDGVIWHKHDGYQRVRMAVLGLAMVQTRSAILLDDDQLPLSHYFVEAYLRQLSESFGRTVVRGLGVTESGSYDLPPFFSTANIGIPMATWTPTFDMRFNGHYGLEDRDYGRTLKAHGIGEVRGHVDTVTRHLGTPYNQVNPNVDLARNERVYFEKWGDLNG